VCLSRGYGGALAGPVRVDRLRHRASDVGDEPLLLAEAATAIVSHDRFAGAQAARAAGGSVIVMDDGLQNPSLIKQAALAVVDGRRGIGNGSVFPAGPLRAPLEAQLACVHAVLVVGEPSGAAGLIMAARARGLRIFYGRLEPAPAVIDALRGSRVLAFAGIGDPAKFFATLDDAGINAPVRQAFADHHRYTRAEVEAILASADAEGLVPLTTEKDFVRLRSDQAGSALAARARTLPVTVRIDDEPAFRQWLLGLVRAA
jgi:tetraacyldisaccharide 4'-kinase